jgi:hypothetical protein
MRKIFFVLTFILLTLTACDKQTKLEKLDASTNNVTREAEKAVNRLDEKICNESDIECLAEKAKHRTGEGLDYVKDKSKEAVDKLD